jgi:hypothetical protein
MPHIVFVRVLIQKATAFFLLSAFFCAAACAQFEQLFPLVSPLRTEDKIAYHMANAKPDTPESIYHVEQLAHLHATQAVPMLEQKFLRTQDPADKAHVASALVRLGADEEIYWDFLIQLATRAVENDAPNFYAYDAHGKTLSGPNPAFIAWADAHHLDHQGLLEQQMYLAPQPIIFLASTADPRGVPLLRRALSSPNHMIAIFAALGLAEIHDDASIPMIIQACQKLPADAAVAMAESLVYFDGSDAQNAVDQFIPKDKAKIYRDARSGGKKSPFSY